MSLDSLPSRPIATAEWRAHHEDDLLRMVTPASVSSERDGDVKRISGLELVRVEDGESEYVARSFAARREAVGN